MTFTGHNVTLGLDRTHSRDIRLAGKGATYGAAIYGEDVYGGEQKIRVIVNLERTYSRTLRSS